jgi:hypothetical protein
MELISLFLKSTIAVIGGWDGKMSPMILFFFYFLIIVVLGVRCDKSFLQYITIEFIPSIILIYPSPPIPGIVSTGLIFPFTYMCI